MWVRVRQRCALRQEDAFPAWAQLRVDQVCTALGVPMGQGVPTVWGGRVPKGPTEARSRRRLPSQAPRSRAASPQSRAFISAISPLHSLFKLYNFCLIVMAYFKITRNQSREVDTAAFIASLR